MDGEAPYKPNVVPKTPRVPDVVQGSVQRDKEGRVTGPLWLYPWGPDGYVEGGGIPERGEDKRDMRDPYIVGLEYLSR
jgi:hypothetical protein